MRLGILGGTFDPIHFGHLKTAEFCQKKLKLDIVLFIPSGNPPHKKAVADYLYRFKMVELALNDYKYFKVSELEKPTPYRQKTYSINTLRKVRSLYPEAKIFFFIGEDNVSQIQSWYKYKELFNYATFVVLSRSLEANPSVPSDRLNQEVNEWNHLDYFSMLQFLDMPRIDISSNMIRNKLAKNLSIDGFVPKIVENYIKKNKLYSELVHPVRY